MLKTYICQIFGHRIDRRRVWHDGLDYRTACARCGTPLLRDHPGWREFEDRDEDEQRLPHPRDRHD